MVVCLALRLRNIGGTRTVEVTLFPTHLRADSLMFGVLLAYYTCYKPDRVAGWCRSRGLILTFGLLLLLPEMRLLQTNPFVFTVGYTLLAVGYGLVLLAVSGAAERSQRLQSIIGRRPVRWLAAVGRCSYSIYLWHLLTVRPFEAWMVAHAPAAGPRAPWWCAITLTYVSASVGVGWLMARLVEFPVLRLRDRVLPSRRTEATGLVPAAARLAVAQRPLA